MSHVHYISFLLLFQSYKSYKLVCGWGNELLVCFIRLLHLRHVEMAGSNFLDKNKYVSKYITFDFGKPDLHNNLINFALTVEARLAAVHYGSKDCRCMQSSVIQGILAQCWKVYWLPSSLGCTQLIQCRSRKKNLYELK